MIDKYDDSSIDVPRSHIFVLIDGVFVVKWSETRVQELLTGRYRHYDRREFGTSITDFELMQLKQAGIVADFDRNVVRLSPSLESSQYYHSGADQRTRAYYLHTTLDASALDTVRESLLTLGMDVSIEPRIRDQFVVLMAENGRAFDGFDEAEEARALLAADAPEVFSETVVAFVETNRRK